MLIGSTKRLLLVGAFLTSQIVVSGLGPSLVNKVEAQEPDLLYLCSQITEATTPNSALDYSDLENLLVSQDWQAADEETLTLVLKGAGQEERGWLGAADMEAFPCSVLQDIDELWLQYSDRRFGFSIQAAIEKDCNNDHSDFYPAAMQCFAEAVDWGNWQDTQFEFSLSAPEGHLPTTNRHLAQALFEACGDYSVLGNSGDMLSEEDIRQCSRGMIIFAYVSPLALIYASDCGYSADILPEVDAVYEQANVL